jgi:hypothetical protein
MLPKTMPVSCEKSDLAEFALSPKPIIKFAARETAASRDEFHKRGA